MTDEGQRHINRFYVFLLGAAVAALAWLWSYNTPPPDLIDDLAAAAGLRPPVEPMGLLWQAIATPFCRWLGVDTAEFLLRNAGHVSLGLLAVFACKLLLMLLPATLRRGEHIASWWRVVVCFVAFQGAALFCLSEPVWNAFRWLSPLSLHVLLTISAALAFMMHLRLRRRAPLYVAFTLLGVLFVDTPHGAVLTFFFFVAVFVRAYIDVSRSVPIGKEAPIVFSILAWRLTFAFLAGAIPGIAVETCTFCASGGMEAFGWSWSDYVLNVPIKYINAWLAACSPLGWALITAVVLLPLLIELELLRRATDNDKHLPYLQGVVFAVLGTLSFSQLSGLSPFWFWTWSSGAEAINNGVLLCLVMFLCSLSLVWSIGVFTIELYFRNFRKIALFGFQDVAEEPSTTEGMDTVKRMQRLVRAFFLMEPLLALALVLPFRGDYVNRSILDLLSDAVKEVAYECRDVEYLFTDGGLDAAVEIAAAKQGDRLSTISFMGRADNARDVYLRTRGVTNAVDRALLELGAADALRTWVRTRPEMSGRYALQIGFELWQRDGRKMPDCSGLAARPEGYTSEEMKRGVVAAHELGKRILALYDSGDPDSISDRKLRDSFLFVQWRLAVLARHRANAYDAKGEKELAVEETRLADELDKRNGALARIRANMSWASKRRLERMTPQEGLRAGLAKADFAMARVFAMRILDIAPDDPSANFAVGMDYFMQKQYSRAEAYLERCLVHRPRDPAVLNNLAQCRLRRGDPEAALRYAERALRVLPDSSQVKRTMEKIQKALEEKRLKSAR